jgi:hypothetical protein
LAPFGRWKSSLIELYRVDRSFLRQGDGTITTQYYAHGGECDNDLQGYYYERRNEPWAFRKDIFYSYHGKKTRQCILSQDGLPAEWRYRITVPMRGTTPLISVRSLRYCVQDFR